VLLDGLSCRVGLLFLACVGGRGAKMNLLFSHGQKFAGLLWGFLGASGFSELLNC